MSSSGNTNVPFEEFYLRHRRVVRQLAIQKIASQRDDTDDVCSEVFLVALTKFSEVGQLTDVAARGWLLRTVELICLNRYRSKRRRDVAYQRFAHQSGTVYASPDEMSANWESAGSAEARDAFESILAQLNPRYRCALIFELSSCDLSGHQKASVLGITHSAQRTLIARSKQAFRRKLGDEFTYSTWRQVVDGTATLSSANRREPGMSG